MARSRRSGGRSRGYSRSSSRPSYRARPQRAARRRAPSSGKGQTLRIVLQQAAAPPVMSPLSDGLSADSGGRLVMPGQPITRRARF